MLFVADGRESDLIAFRLPPMSRCMDKKVSANLKLLSALDGVANSRIRANELSRHSLAGVERRSIRQASQPEHNPEAVTDIWADENNCGLKENGKAFVEPGHEKKACPQRSRF